ncbi:MAG: GNAT family protein [Chitinophagaceae bacterium]
MKSNRLSVREIKETDIPLILDYWLSADADFLAGMGADIAKLPARQDWEVMLAAQLSQPYKEKQSYCIIWLADDVPVGHSNTNKIQFGEEAYMHLHLWKADKRQKGMGAELVKMTLPYFFNKLQLKRLYCEPYALNPAPNKTLEKVGFTFVKEHLTIPGSLNFEQPAKLWELTYNDFIKLK